MMGIVLVDWQRRGTFARREELRRTVGLRFCSICLMTLAWWVVAGWLCCLARKRNMGQDSRKRACEKFTKGICSRVKATHSTTTRLLQHCNLWMIDHFAHQMGIDSTPASQTCSQTRIRLASKLSNRYTHTIAWIANSPLTPRRNHHRHCRFPPPWPLQPHSSQPTAFPSCS